MGRREERTPTEIMVRVLDLTEMTKAAFEKLHPKCPHCGGTIPDPRFEKATGCKVMYTYGVVETRRGLYLIDNEGTGSAKPVSEENRGEIDFYPYGDGVMYAAPALTAFLNEDELRETISPTTVNLADFIRTFGSRLETNYDIWRKKLEEEV